MPRAPNVGPGHPRYSGWTRLSLEEPDAEPGPWGEAGNMLALPASGWTPSLASRLLARDPAVPLASAARRRDRPFSLPGRRSL